MWYYLTPMMMMAFSRKAIFLLFPLKPHPAFPVHYPSQTTSCSNMDAQPGAAAARMTWSQGGLRNRCTPFLGDGKRCEVHLASLQRLGNRFWLMWSRYSLQKYLLSFLWAYFEFAKGGNPVVYKPRE